MSKTSKHYLANGKEYKGSVHTQVDLAKYIVVCKMS